MGVGIEEMLTLLPHAIAAPEKFAAVQDGFVEFGLVLVFIGAFTPLPYKVIAVSAGIAGFALIPFLVISFVGRGLRFAIIAGIARHHHTGNERKRKHSSYQFRGILLANLP